MCVTIHAMQNGRILEGKRSLLSLVMVVQPGLQSKSAVVWLYLRPVREVVRLRYGQLHVQNLQYKYGSMCEMCLRPEWLLASRSQEAIQRTVEWVQRQVMQECSL